MNQVDRNSSKDSKGNADKQAVLPTDNSPKKSSQANQDGTTKPADSNAAGKGKRETGAENNSGSRQAGNNTKR